MKTLLMTLLLSATLTGGSIYDYKMPGLDGTDIDLSKYKGKKIKSTNFVIADPSVLKLFPRDFIEGSAATALSEPGFAIITESIALGLFGHSDVVGRVVHFNEFEKDLTIRGVIADDARRHSLAKLYGWEEWDFVKM